MHRRAGKDVFCVEAWILRALKRIGTHAYLFPLVKQAREVIWNGMDFTGRPFISAIPEILIAKKNDARMEITLINGSRMVLGGSNNFNSIMGANPVTVIYSEFALHNPLARQYINPILVQNKGIEIIQSTPRGKNHLFELYQTVRDNPKYCVQHLGYKETTKCDGTPIITEEDIIEAKMRGMSEEMIRQEFSCDFEVGNIGAYLTVEISDMVREGRITTLPFNPRIPIHTVWDLGGTDATAGLLFQVDGKYANVIAMLHSNGKGFKWYLDEAEEIRKVFNGKWGMHFAPHDVSHKHQGFEHTESRLTQARKYGWQFQVLPKINFEDGIEQLRYVMPRLRIDKNRCNLAVRALTEYQRKWDEAKAMYSPKPLDNWAVHIADAFRYLSIAYRRVFEMPQYSSAQTEYR